ncbi:MAG: translocation/assembly module TamB domain-containing protein [Desulfamplus sp.]|nr:translocation/assembly module TamB domain-containing protein [Desulfamplus sp.]
MTFFKILFKFLIMAVYGVAGLLLFSMILIISIVFYMDSQHCSQMLQSQINSRIPGEMVWRDIGFSPLKGEFTLREYGLMLHGEEIAGFDELRVKIDTSRLTQKEIVFENISLDGLRADIVMDHHNNLNVLKAFPQSDQGGSDEPETVGFMDKLPFNVVIDSLVLKNSDFKYRSLSQALEASMDHISLWAEADMMARSMGIIFKGGPGRFGQEEMDIHWETISLGGQYLWDGLDNIDIEVVSQAGDIHIQGSITDLLSILDRDSSSPSSGNGRSIPVKPSLDNMDNPGIHLTLDADISASKLMAMLAVSHEIAGQIKAHIRMDGDINDPSLVWKLDCQDILVMGRPVNSILFEGNMQNRVVAVPALSIDHPQGRITARGDVSLARAFPRGFTGGHGNFPELISWDINIGGERLEPGKILENEGIKGVAGELDFTAALTGEMKNPRAHLTLNARGAAYGEYPAGDLNLDLSFMDGTVHINSLDIFSCGARLGARGDVRLMDADTLILFDAPGLNINLWTMENIDIRHCLGEIKGSGFDFLTSPPLDKMGGELSLGSSLKGTPEDPALTLDLSIDNFTAAEERIQRIELKAAYEKGEFEIPSLEAIFGEHGTVMARAWMADGNFKASFHSMGIDLGQIEAVRKNGVSRGVAKFDISAAGSLDAPEVNGEIALLDMIVMDRPVEDFNARISLMDDELLVRGRLNFDLDARYHTGSGDFHLQAGFQETDILPWLTLAGIQDVGGGITGTISIEGNRDTPLKPNIRCSIREFSLNHGKYEHGRITLNNIEAWSDGRMFRAEPFTITLPRDGTMSLSSWGDIEGDIHLVSSARVSAASASLFLDTLPPMEGDVTLDLKASLDMAQHDPSAPKNTLTLDATLGLHEMAITLPDNLGRITKINGGIIGNTERVEISGITGKFGTGGFIITGGADLENLIPSFLGVSIRADSIPLDIVEGLDGLVHAEMDLEAALFDLSLEGALLKGDIVLENGRWTRNLSVEKELFSTLTSKKRVRKEAPKPSSPDPLMEKIALDISIKGKTPFVVDNNLAYMAIHPDIKVQGSAAKPVVSGRSEINPGTLTYHSSEFTLTRGIIDFVNPYAIEPHLDIESHRAVRKWDVKLAVSGTPDSLDFQLTSEPGLEDGDIISLLLRGKTVSELIGAEGGTTMSAAGMLSQVAASSVSDNLKAATGLDIFEVGFGNSSESNGLSDMNVTVGKELTDKVTVTYGAETRDGEMVHKTAAEYKLSDSVSVKGFQDSAGDFGGEVRYRLEFR